MTVNDDAFVRTCDAVADFDNTPPTVRVDRFRISRAGRADAVQMTFNMTDNVAANLVSFRVAVLAAGRRIGGKVGTRAGGNDGDRHQGAPTQACATADGRPQGC